LSERRLILATQTVSRVQICYSAGGRGRELVEASAERREAKSNFEAWKGGSKTRRLRWAQKPMRRWSPGPVPL